MSFERYLRHGLKFGADEAFWRAAADDLTRRDLRRLSAELGVKLPEQVGHPSESGS